MSSESFDYSKLTSTLIQAIYTASNGRHLIESASVGEMPKYPFCQYTYTSPHRAITSDIVDNEVFEIIVSLTWRGLSGHEVLNLANVTNKWFRSQKGRFFMQENDVVVVDVLNYGLRDTLISIEYERMAGLDLRLRVRDPYTQDIDEIESMSIDNQGGM